MHTVNHCSKRMLALLLVCVLCINLCFSTGLPQRVVAEEVAASELDLMDSASFSGKTGVLSYDVNKKEGWIGGNGTTASTDMPARYFSYNTYGSVIVGGEPVPLTTREVTYSVTFSDFAYDTATYPSGVRQQGVILMLQYNDGSKNWTLENRFGGTMYNSGHYMQVGGTGSTLLNANAGAPFYSESVKNSVIGFPALADGDTISLKVKCANGAENGYIKLLLNGEEKHSFVYTGTKLPEFGLKSCKLMAKMSNISLKVDGATGWSTCTGHVESEQIVDAPPTDQQEGRWHTECTLCGETMNTGTIPALAGMELINADASLVNQKASVLTYDVNTKEGWIGGDGTTASTTQQACYFQYTAYKNVMVGGKAVPLTDCEVTYSVTFSDFAYDTATYPSGVRQQGVVLMLQYNDGVQTWKLENRFGGEKYASGHYMQIDGTNSTLLADNAGAPFYSESVKNSVTKFPALANGDTISLKVKCATNTENGYIKLLLNGEEKHSFVYTGKELPQFGLKSCKLMAKISDISLKVAGATGWVSSACENPVWEKEITAPTCGEPGYTTYTCTNCGESYTDDKTPPLGHTCKDGVCTVCGAKEWDTDGDGVLEILAFGNSFSVDALEYVWQIANNLGIEKIVLGNLNIGGCSLQTHAANAAGDLGNYNYRYSDSGNWSSTDGYKISTALASRSWDYVSLQQQSGKSGLIDTYNEDLTYLVSYIKERSYAKLIWHMTWAYQQDSTNDSFANYHKDQMKMYNDIVATVRSKICTNSDFDLIVPNGTAVQNSRTTPLGDTTTRDGYHMSTDYGRYLTGLMFFKTVTGLSIDGITYAPAGVDGVEKSYAIESVNNAYAKPFEITQSSVQHKPGTAVKENVSPATCTTPACYDIVVYCTECSAEMSRETVVTAPALGHKYVDGVCTVCGKNEGVDLITSATFDSKDGVLFYDVNRGQGWIGGDGTTTSTDASARYFTYNTFGNVIVGGEAVPLTSCEVTYSVTFSGFDYDTPSYPNGVRQEGVILMLRYNDGNKVWTLENRFGDMKYQSGHYMQVNGANSTLLADNAGAPFYSERKNSIANFPVLLDGDTISLRVKCANGSENGYIKLLLNGDEKHSFVYTGTKLPEFGLKSFRLMAKMSNISLTVEGATGWSECVTHVESDRIVDVQPGINAEGKWHTECTACGEIINTGTIPALIGMELINTDTSLKDQKASVLFYDASKKKGWIGGNGTKASTEMLERYFSCNTIGNVLVGGESVPLTSREVTYSVTFSDFAYNTAAYPSGVRQQGVILMLRYNDWTLENRFGDIMYDSGHYMQVGSSGSTLLDANAGAPFYSESVKNSVADFPALANGDTISLKVKCATKTENGYIKLLLNGEEMHTFVYTGTKLPEFGLKSFKLMAKISNISLSVDGATGRSECKNHTEGERIVDAQPGVGAEGKWHTECTVCGKTIKTGTIPALAGMELLDTNASLMGQNKAVLSYDIAKKEGWIGGNGATPSTSTVDSYFTFPIYKDVLADGKAVDFTDCELIYSMVFSDFNYEADKNCRNSAVCLMLRYTDGDKVYKLENRFGGIIYDSGHYMQTYVNGIGVGNVLQDTGAPFYSTSKNSFMYVPALENGDRVELRIKCANDTQKGYIKLFLNGAEIGEFVYTGTAFPEFGLESMKLMAKVSNVSLMVNGAAQWAECTCAVPNVKRYETTTQSTCTTDGLKSGKCVDCDNLHTVVIPAGHVETKDWIVDLEADCTQEGSRHKECMICFEYTQEETIPARGHRPYWVEDKAATKLTAGSKHEECMVCKAVLSTQEIPPEWNPVLVIGGGVVLIAGLAVGIIFLVKIRRKK